MRRFLSLSILFTFSLCSLQAQKVDEKLKEEAVKLKAIFKEDEIAALKATSSYTFSLAGSSLSAERKESYQYLALRSNTTFTVRNFFNDKTYIESYSLKSESGRTALHDKFCGHYQQGDIFYSDAQICAYRFTLSLPGQSARFESTLIYSDPRYLTPVFFHGETPAREREIIISVPRWATIELMEMNFNGFNVKKNITEGQDIITYSYVVRDLESFPDDKNLPGYLHFMPHILILTKSFDYKGSKTTILSSTDDQYKWYASLTSKLVKNYDQLKPIVTDLTKNSKTNEEKIKAIYYWVQDNIKYIAFEDGLAAFKPEDAHEVYYKRYGDCKGMANLTKAMLTVAGFDARLTWIGTNKIPYTYAIPSLAVDNHMICSVFDNGKHYILDPTDKYNPIGINGESIQGKQALIENNDTYIISEVKEESIEKYLQESIWNYEVVENRLIGNGKTSMEGENKKMVFNFYNNLEKEDLEKFLKAIVAGGNNPDDFSLKNYSAIDRDNQWNISYDMTLKNQLYLSNKEMYVDLDFVDDYKEVKLDKERKVPYKFSTKAFKKVRAELSIPVGYKLEHLPKAFRMENEHFFFDMNYTLINNKVVYTKEIKILKNILPVSEFNNWNKAIAGINEFYNDQIILKSND